MHFDAFQRLTMRFESTYIVPMWALELTTTTAQNHQNRIGCCCRRLPACLLRCSYAMQRQFSPESLSRRTWPAPSGGQSHHQRTHERRRIKVKAPNRAWWVFVCGEMKTSSSSSTAISSDLPPCLLPHTSPRSARERRQTHTPIRRDGLVLVCSPLFSLFKYIHLTSALHSGGTERLTD